MAYEHFQTDDYIDRSGRKWFCVRMKDYMRCTDENGAWTAANFATFQHWGWKRVEPKST